MFVTRRDRREAVWMEPKWMALVEKLAHGLMVNAATLAAKVVPTLSPGMSTGELLEQTARVAAQLTNLHPDYSILAGRFLVAEWRKTCPPTFSACVKALAYASPPLVSPEVAAVVQAHAVELDAVVVHQRDEQMSYFGIKTLERSYLLKMQGRLMETAQYLYMRVALGIYGMDLTAAIALYHALSEGLISHASPTMFNAGTPHPQLASCFLMAMDGDQDSISSIFSTLGKCAEISKYAGGIGLHVHTIRAAGSFIHGTNGTSNGIVPMLRVFDATAKYVDQGGNKRPGAMAIYLEPWHADIYEFLDLKLPTGVEELRARDLFYGLWVPDLFMRRVAANGTWTLMDPRTAPCLDKVWGPDFEELYETYERENRGLRQVPARELWSRIIRAQKETGTPYMLFKDHCNRKSNQKYLGTIASSNLCVAGDTLITTDKGPRCIKEIVAGPDVTTSGEAAAYHKTQAQITELEALADRTADQQSTLAVLKTVLQSLKPPVPVPPKQPAAALVNIWNGQSWREVTPKQTGAHKELLRITTSHGTVLDCTPEHVFILADNTRVAAHALQLGTRLQTVTDTGCPVVYPGDAAHGLADDVAFRRGFVYGYAVLKKGAEQLNGAMPQLKVPFVLMTKESVSPETLRVFGYDAGWARETFPDLDHELLAPCSVPTADQTLQTRLSGPVATREKWAQGFMAALNQVLPQARASYAFLHKAWLMLRSLGRDVRLVPVDNKGLWQLKPGQAESIHPVVTGLQYVPGLHDTYCFTEPERSAGVFGELLTGQCAEIIEYSDPDQIAVCNLASVCLSKCVANGQFDFERLQDLTRVLVNSLNTIIDRTLYMLPEMKKSNLQHRPIGIGVQGLADVFAQLHLAWDSPDARQLNRAIFEHMYFAALQQSNILAKQHGPYATFQQSPAHEGILQFDMWNVSPSDALPWLQLKDNIKKHGLRNSLLLACMPTASTAQILGNNESIEPFTSNVYTRSVLSGEFQVVNRYLVRDLLALNLWNEELLHDIVRHNGSIQHIDTIPAELKNIYKTVWEIPQRVLIDLAADRGAFICQSQSFNLHMRAPTDNQLHNAHFYAWERGLKTGMYYLRTRPAVDPVKVTLAPAALACARENREACVMCSA